MHYGCVARYIVLVTYEWVQHNYTIWPIRCIWIVKSSWKRTEFQTKSNSNSQQLQKIEQIYSVHHIEYCFAFESDDYYSFLRIMIDFATIKVRNTADLLRWSKMRITAWEMRHIHIHNIQLLLQKRRPSLPCQFNIIQFITITISCLSKTARRQINQSQLNEPHTPCIRLCYATRIQLSPASRLCRWTYSVRA